MERGGERRGRGKEGKMGGKNGKGEKGEGWKRGNRWGYEGEKSPLGLVLCFEDVKDSSSFKSFD